MSNVLAISAVLTLLAGIGVFLVACSMMTSNLEALGSSKMRELFASASKSKLLGVGIGALGTAAIQSSGATTVIAIGFVNAGIMSLAQAATVIYGANIGTTITGQIVAWGISGEGGISTTLIFAALTGIGAFIVSFASQDKVKTLGGILCGFGMLFVGLSMMSGAMESFADLEPVRLFLAGIGNAFLLMIIGAVLTAIIQSSSVMTSVAITMVLAGLISLDQGIYLTMGSNIGSCVVALIAGMTGSASAKRASLIHLIFNVAGVALFMVIGYILAFATGGSVSFGTIFGSFFPDMPQVELAMFHTVFNVVAVILMLPLTDALVALVVKLVPEEQEAEELRTYFIDESLFITPPIAVQQTKNEIINMSDIAMQNFQAAIEAIRMRKVTDRAAFDRNENELDYLNRELGHYTAKLFGEQLSERDRRFLSTALHSVSDLERIGDYAEDIVEYSEKMDAADISFTDAACDEIFELEALVNEQYMDVIQAYIDGDQEALSRASARRDDIQDQIAEMELGHVDRIAAGECTPEAGGHFLSLLNDVDRVCAHLFNLAKTVRGEGKVPVANV